MKTRATSTRHRVGKFAIAIVIGAGLVGALAPSAIAQDSTDTSNGNGTPAAGQHRPKLTDAQKACLQQHGAEKPARGPNGERPQLTDAQRQALQAAAKACGITLPARRHHLQLTDAQKACLQQHGVQKPQPGANGERPKPTDAQRQAFQAAAKACGINLPDRPNANSTTPSSNSTAS